AEDLAQAAVEDGGHLIDLFGRDDQRRAEGDPGGGEPAEQAPPQPPAADPDAEGRRLRVPLLGPPLTHELQPLEEPPAPDVADAGVFASQLREAGAEPAALGLRIAEEVLIEDLPEHRDPGGARNRVALERVPLDEPRVLGDRPPEGLGDRLPADH